MTTYLSKVKHPPTDVLQALGERVTPIFLGEQILPPSDRQYWGNFPCLIDIVNVVDRIHRSNAELFRIVRHSGRAQLKACDLGTRVLDVLAVPRHALRRQLALYDLDPRIELFWQEADLRGIHSIFGASNLANFASEEVKISTLDAHNGFVEAIRKKCRRQAFQKKVSSRMRSTLNAFDSLRSYFLRLLDSHPGLLPITFDLSYRTGCPHGSFCTPETLTTATFHLDELVRKIRAIYGVGVIGYAWAQDAIQGLGNGGHLVLLTDMASEEIYAFCTEVQRTWVEDVTGGTGCVYEGLQGDDPRFHFRRQSPRDRTYTPLQEQLSRMALYLRLTDRYMALKPARGASSHRTGTLPRLAPTRNPSTQVGGGFQPNFPFPCVEL